MACRPKETLRGLLRQVHRAGRTDARLYRDYRNVGLPRDPVVPTVKTSAWLVLHLPSVLRAARSARCGGRSGSRTGPVVCGAASSTGCCSPDSFRLTRPACPGPTGGHLSNVVKLKSRDRADSMIRGSASTVLDRSSASGANGSCIPSCRRITSPSEAPSQAATIVSVAASGRQSPGSTVHSQVVRRRHFVATVMRAST